MSNHVILRNKMAARMLFQFRVSELLLVFISVIDSVPSEDDSYHYFVSKNQEILCSLILLPRYPNERRFSHPTELRGTRDYLNFKAASRSLIMSHN